MLYINNILQKDNTKSIFRILLWMSCEGYLYFLSPEQDKQLKSQENDMQSYGSF